MEEHQTITEPVAAAAVKPMSFSEKITNLFAAPGELYEEVRLTPKTTSNWLIPMVIFIVAAIIMGQIMVRNPSLADQMGSMIKQGLEKSVQEGKMTQEQVDNVYDNYAKPGTMMFTISQIGGAIIMTPVALFLMSLVYWLLGKTAMKSTAPYMKVTEVVGLTLIIGALEYVITALLMVSMDSIHATPSLALVVPNFQVDNKMHLLLSKLNIFTFWSLALISIGLSKLFRRDLPKVAVLVFVLWALWTAVTVLTGFGTGR